MKKNLLLLWGMTLFLAFVGCSSDNEGGKNPLEENYFTIESAVFHDSDLPVGDHSLIYNLNVNSNVITGGSTLISFASQLELSKAFIGVEGMKGYYEYNLLKTKTTYDAYRYEILLLISQNVTDKDFGITLSVQTVDGQISQEEVADVDVIETGTGDLQISLWWDELDDVDLHVIDPLGNHISYEEPFSFKGDVDLEEADFNFAIYMIKKYTSYNTDELDYNDNETWYLVDDYMEEIIEQLGRKKFMDEMFSYMEENYSLHGFLDLDSNAGCSVIDAINNENIYFNNPVNGEYKIYVDLYKKCDESAPGAKYSLTVNYKGSAVKVSEKQLGQFPANYEGSRDDEYQHVYIGSFTVGDSRSSSSSVNELPVKKNISKWRQNLFAK